MAFGFSKEQKVNTHCIHHIWWKAADVVLQMSVGFHSLWRVAARSWSHMAFVVLATQSLRIESQSGCMVYHIPPLQVPKLRSAGWDLCGIHVLECPSVPPGLISPAFLEPLFSFQTPNPLYFSLWILALGSGELRACFSGLVAVGIWFPVLLDSPPLVLSPLSWVQTITFHVFYRYLNSFLAPQTCWIQN